ncbi:alpha/beta fold hydrolase [Psychrobacillus soli]|uniref:Alpha/beta fold hydrolase n=1 Tax=Psychrobacillus soli TaxID=1543965 RepID=A0A544STS9_9BACI|nr:alpha/beta hydrolase [Psychrobacillus soli]TQR08573.1 alpha/beta fold hydrolase [Psychrobacillus soli]
MKENFVTFNGIESHYWEGGSGYPLILIHGGGAGADGWGNWNHIMDKYVSQGFHVIAYDVLGYGLSSRPDPVTFNYTQEARVDQLVSLISGLDLNRVSLIGNSLGGAIAASATAKLPEKINKLVLMGASGRRKPNDNSEGVRTLATYNNEREHMERIIRNLTNEQFVITEELLDYRLKMANDPATSAAYQATMSNLNKNGLFILDEDLKSIKQKTLIVHGREDNQVPLQFSLEYEHLIENAWLHVMPKCGHWAMIEYPEEFVKLTVDFLKNY